MTNSRCALIPRLKRCYFSKPATVAFSTVNLLSTRQNVLSSTSRPSGRLGGALLLDILGVRTLRACMHVCVTTTTFVLMKRTSVDVRGMRRQDPTSCPLRGLFERDLKQGPRQRLPNRSDPLVWKSDVGSSSFIVPSFTQGLQIRERESKFSLIANGPFIHGIKSERPICFRARQ